MGEGVSAQTISNMAESLDEEVRRHHRRRIEDRYLYLFLDGIVLKKKHLDSCIKEARAIYNATNKKKAERAYSKWEKKWNPIAPTAVRCIEKDLKELLNFYSCPKKIWTKVRTTNVIERAFREVRRMTRPMSCFNHDQSIERIVYAVLSHLNEQRNLHKLIDITHSP